MLFSGQLTDLQVKTTLIHPEAGVVGRVLGVDVNLDLSSPITVRSSYFRLY